MAYIGHEHYDIVNLMAAIKAQTGLVPTTTLCEVGTASTSSTSYATLKSYTCGSDGGVLVAYIIDPDSSSVNGYLKVETDSPGSLTTMAEMTTAGSKTTTNFLVGLAFDNSHADNVSAIFVSNGDELRMSGKSVGGTLFVQYLYFEYDLN